jgi:hypothetical protein
MRAGESSLLSTDVVSRIMRELVPDVFDLLVTGSGGAEELFESLAAHPDHNERYAMEAYQHYSRDDDTVRRIGLPSGALVMPGTPSQVAERIKELHETQACGGIALTFPLWHAEEIGRFTRCVLPLLADMGIWVSSLRRGWSW